MHDDRKLAERRIERELWERIMPHVHEGRRPLTIEAGPTPDELSSFESGSSWGAAWQTTWFRITGEVPADWSQQPRSTRIEAVIDLGFTRSPAGFQAEGLVVEPRGDGSYRPLQGIHPRRTNFVLDPLSTRVDVLVEAASNPTFAQFVPSQQGSLDTASTDPIYRFRTADVVLVDVETEALVHDLDIAQGLMHALDVTDPRRTKLRRSIVDALDAFPDVQAARRCVAPHLVAVGGGSRRHRIVATGHAHIDTAWLWPIRETVRKCTRTFASAVALMDDDPTYRFSCSQAQQYAWIEERHPDLFARIVDKVRAGQWLPVGGMWVEADMNLPSGESLARQIVYGQRYFTEKFGAPCREVWIPDVFGYPAGLPQLFRAGGMDRFVTQKLSWNKQNRFPHHTFHWEGLDGSQVLTHFPPVDTYNAEITPGEVAHSIASFKEHSWSDVSLMPFGHGDGGGGPTREMLERAHRLAAIDPDVTLEIGSTDDFFAALEREVVRGADVPVWRGELYFETHRGTLTSQLRTKVGNRRTEHALFEAELWEATIGERPSADELEKIGARPISGIWPDVLTQQFHDILPGSSIAWVHSDAEKVFASAQRELAGHAHLAAERLGTGDSAANPAGVDHSRVVVVEASGDAGNVDLDRLTHIAPDRVQRIGDRECAIALDVPAFGIAPVVPRVVTDRVVVTDCSMTNGRLAVRWNKHGELTSIIDIAAQRELIPVGEHSGVIELGRDQPVEYDAWDLESWTREASRPVGRGVVTIDAEGPLVGRIRVTNSFGPSEVVTTFQLRAESRQLDIEVDVDWHHDEHLLSMAFPIDVRADTAACDVQFGVTHRPTHPSSPWDAAKFEVCAHRFVSVAEPSFGVAVLNDGRYGHSIFGGAIRVSLARAAKYPDPDADHGRHRVRLAIRAHDGDLGQVRAAAELLNRPLTVSLGASADVGVGVPVDPILAIVGADGEAMLGVEVDAVKLADDGPHTQPGDLIVRLHEAIGDRTRITLRTRRRIGAAWSCDLMETPQRGHEVGDGVLSLTLRPFELATLRLRQTDDWDGRSGTGVGP
ncbi:MAG: glycoside hydrolase family 38 C-terminal domain-containing protein [Ilumatobacter sp.]|uniref:alpha-mannosidase n=1 Tax=Ilumatobacter sp. TaxID=1967498 RepID=UPI0032998CB4